VVSKKNNSKRKNTVLATFGLMLLSLGIASSILVSVLNNASAQENQQQQQPGLLEGLEREQSGESLPGDQPADIGGPAPLNATTAEEGGNATNATMTGAAGNTTNMTVAGNATNATTAGNATNATMTGAGNATTGGEDGNQTDGGTLDVITEPFQDLFGGGGQ
jgi:cytoskeletal protein RodZ